MKNLSIERLPKKYVEVLGKKMAYCEIGEGKPIIFQHGNPTSSYLWRNVMPHLENQGRCIAIDLIGMGDSDKLDAVGNNSYSYHVQKKYFDACLEALNVNHDVIFVTHDWGTSLGFNWAYEHPDNTKGICYMEGFVKEMKWEDWTEEGRELFQGFRSEAGEEMVMQNNLFVEMVLPVNILRKLSDREMNEYRRPFLEEKHRRPTLDWPRQIPVDSEPEEICHIVEAYSKWMAENDMPKLFINAEPGALITGPYREFCRKWKNQTEVTVKGIHFIQEDSPHEIGIAIQEWFQSF